MMVPLLWCPFTASTAAAQDDIRLGVMWIGKSGMSLRVYEGFSEHMAKYAPEIKLEKHIELEDEAAALPVYNKFQSEKNGLVFLRSSGVKFLINHPPQKPTFIGGCNNPAALGAMKDLKTPPTNITGVTYYIPAERQINAFKKVFPKLKSIGLLVEKDHPSSLIDSRETAAACKEEGIEFHDFPCASKEDIISAVKAIYDKKLEAIVIGNQALIFDNGEFIAKNAADIPVLSYAEKPVNKGFALCGLVADDNKLGRMMADSVIQVLLKGSKAEEIPIQTDPGPKFTVNLTVMKKLGINISPALIKYAKTIE